MVSKQSTLLWKDAGSNPRPPHHKIRPYLKLVETKRENEIFNRVVEVHHGYVPTTHYGGRRINWLIMDRRTRKILGAIGIGSAIMALKPRDEWIGWSRRNRLKYLVRIANNWRFCLIDKIPNLGSKVLSLLCKLSVKEWKKRYGDDLVLLETLVEPPYDGTVYKAAGWKFVGWTKGTEYRWFKKDEIPFDEGWHVVQRYMKYGDKIDYDTWQCVRENGTAKKMIYVKPLIPNFREYLLGLK